MAGVPERESIRIHDQYEEWMRVSESIVQLLDDYEQYRHNASNVSARENVAIRMESVVVLLQQVIAFITWLAPRAGKMSQILRCDWLPERARWSYLARSGLPVARPLGIESLIQQQCNLFFDFLVVLGRNAH